MPHNARRLGRIPGFVALAAVLAIASAWAPVPHWRGGLQASGGHAAAAVAAAVDPAPSAATALARAGVRVAAAQVAMRERLLASADLGSRRVPAESAKTAVVDAPEPSKPAAPKYSGKNHVWIPALRMSYPVLRFPCPRQRAPDNYMYRWECAGKNNVYLMGHAYGVMKPLHDAYAAGRLRVGMVAVYADARGRIRTYAVTEWRVSRVGATFYWGIADQPVPSMTLQTCWGRDSEYRLKVRLVAID